MVSGSLICLLAELEFVRLAGQRAAQHFTGACARCALHDLTSEGSVICFLAELWVHAAAAADSTQHDLTSEGSVICFLAELWVHAAAAAADSTQHDTSQVHAHLLVVCSPSTEIQRIRRSHSRGRQWLDKPALFPAPS
jgi:hypothetical protein